MNKGTIQTLHPEKGKQNKRIPADKYEVVKTAILQVLQHSEPTHTELVDLVSRQLKNTFDENISWYTMTVKLDLEARGMIERIGSNPQRYRLK